MCTLPDTTSPRFFSLAQAHVAESVQSASVTTNIPLQSATLPGYGMVLHVEPREASRNDWLQQTASHSVVTGKYQGAADLPVMQTNTDAQDVERSAMGLKDPLEWRRHEPLTPYTREAWAELLQGLGLEGRYPSIVQGLADSFDIGIPCIMHTYTPPNHHSVMSLPHVYSSIIDSEFSASCYIGPFTQSQLELALGPFQTSLLSLVPKTSKPGTYRAVHNFSHPHNPSPDATSINSHIDCDNFPCTWGTFLTITLLISCLPPGSQASICNVAEAYRTIPITPAQWPSLVVQLQAEDQFAINTCNNFGLTSAGGVYGLVADTGTDIFQGTGLRPIVKWVDDHIFFQIPWAHLPSYNT
jgi:hypothetical protein